MHVQRLKLHNYEGNTQELHSLVCSAHNIGMSKGHLEEEKVRGSFVIRIYSCKKLKFVVLHLIMGMYYQLG